MVAAVPGVVGEKDAPHWRHYLRGLWASGLRLGESLDLWWDRPEKIFPVFPRDGRPMLQVPGEPLVTCGCIGHRQPNSPAAALAQHGLTTGGSGAG